MATITVNHNPIVVTDGPIAASTKVTDDFLYVQKIVWYGATTAGHKANVVDKDGNLLFHFDADAPGASGIMMYSYDFPVFPHPCYGIYVDDMDSGSIAIYTVSRY